jgi:hypothetical protein
MPQVGRRNIGAVLRERELHLAPGTLGGLCCDSPDNYRDVARLGDVQVTAVEVAAAMGLAVRD